MPIKCQWREKNRLLYNIDGQVYPCCYLVNNNYMQGEMGMMTPSELKRLREELGMKKGGEVQKMEAGGLVGDQVKLDKNKDGKISGADFKMMEKGGAVRKKKGKGKKSGSSCRGAGAAVKGTRFSGIR